MAVTKRTHGSASPTKKVAPARAVRPRSARQASSNKAAVNAVVADQDGATLAVQPSDATVQIDGPTEDELDPQVGALRTAEAWSAIIDLVGRRGASTLGLAGKAAYCRAIFHLLSGDTVSIVEEATCILAETLALDVLASEQDASKVQGGSGSTANYRQYLPPSADHTQTTTSSSPSRLVDARICLAALLAHRGDHSAASDHALEAFKASEYKDKDALAIMQASSAKKHTGRQNSQKAETSDHYTTLHLLPSAAPELVEAAYTVLSRAASNADDLAGKPVSPQTDGINGSAAISTDTASPDLATLDRAHAVLSNPASRASYDDLLAKRKSGSYGGGKEFSGGTEVLRALVQTLGVAIPEGFTWPENGRFQGGFGGGFEYTWGPAGEASNVVAV